MMAQRFESQHAQVDKRTSPRRRTLKAGKVILSDWTSIDCTIRDLSEGGAKLEFGGVVILPPEFQLLIVSENTLIPTALVRHHGLQAGIRFTGPMRNAPPRKW
jgi:hypothetical protein